MGRSNHNWTPEELEVVRRDYKGTNASSRAIAAELGVTEFAVKGQAAKMGLMQPKMEIKCL